MFSEEGVQKALLMSVNPQTKEMDGKKYVIWNMDDPSDSTLRETSIKFLAHMQRTTVAVCLMAFQGNNFINQLAI